MEDLQEAYLAIYEESDVASRTKRAGTHGDDDAITSVKKATKHKGAKVTPSMPESFDSYDVVLDYLLDEGFVDSENNAITMMANMSEEWIDTILDEAARDVIMTVTSPSGQERSKIRTGATRASDSHRHETPEQIKRRGFSQWLAKNETERQEKMAAGRFTVATKRGIQAASREIEGTVPTDYHARRRRASGR